MTDTMKKILVLKFLHTLLISINIVLSVLSLRIRISSTKSWKFHFIVQNTCKMSVSNLLKILDSAHNNFQIKPYTITEFYKCINSKGKNNEPVVVLRIRTLLTFKNFFHSNFIIILYNFFITFLWLYTSHSFFFSHRIITKKHYCFQLCICYIILPVSSITQMIRDIYFLSFITKEVSINMNHK